MNAACAGPRRPSRTTSSICAFASSASAWSAVSVRASSAGSSTSIRATSTATLPLPITTALPRGQVELLVGGVGVAVVPGDESGRRIRAGPILARDAEPVVVRGPDRVHDRVIALEQLGAGDVRAQLDAAEEPKARLGRRLVVDPRDRLDLRVVRSDTGADQPERRRQRVDQVDLEAGVEQLIGGVEAGRTGADHRGASMCEPAALMRGP